MRDPRKIKTKHTCTDGRQLELAIRDALCMVDPDGGIMASVSVIGMTKVLAGGFDPVHLLHFTSRFSEAIADSGPVRNLSVYVWPEDGWIKLRAAHDGRGDWVQELVSWSQETGTSLDWELRDSGTGHVTIAFPRLGPS